MYFQCFQVSLLCITLSVIVSKGVLNLPIYALNQCFPNINVHMNHLGIILKCRL